MAIFEPCLQRTLNFEGRNLTNTPGDAGKRTFWGISEVFNPNWLGWDIIDNCGITDPRLPNLVSLLYQSSYWNNHQLSQFTSQQLATQVFDSCVNIGDKSIEALQTLVGVKPDAVMGPDSIHAVNTTDEQEIVYGFLGWRKLYYHNDVVAKPSKAVDLNGWLSRCVIAPGTNFQGGVL